MRFALLSDIHGKQNKLQAVLVDAHLRGAQQTLSLGDVGDDGCLALLQEAGARAVFGNYEVSGWSHLTNKLQRWIQSWPPMLAEDRFLAVHAAPWWPEGLNSVQDFGAWLQKTRQPWRALFPYLTEDEDLVWQALAELQKHGKSVLFHGHTHQQSILQCGPNGQVRALRSASVLLRPDSYYVVGVGSVGLPEDGSWAAYALYDSEASRIDLIQVEP